MQDTIKNRTIFCHDNLDILRGINSNSIDLIYLDPPFNKKKTFTAPIGSSAEGASFSDIFREEDVKQEWLKEIEEDHHAIHELLNAVNNIEGKRSYNFCYLAYMAIRLMECHRVLAETGSIYLHCDQTMSHYLKLLMDCIFGEKNFRNEIIWYYPNKLPDSRKKLFTKSSDTILFYVKNINTEFYFETQAEKRDKPVKDRRIKKVDGKKVTVRGDDGKPIYDIYTHRTTDNIWRIPMLTGRVKERLGYPTQKPLALLERIIRTSTKQNDTVLDPFCGCATTCVAAERLNRQWVGIDISYKAYELVKERLAKEIEGENTLFHENLVSFKTSAPKRTDMGDNPITQKYVYIISHEKYSGEYKIGIAGNVKSRLNSYQTGDPNRAYKLEYSLYTPYFREIEKYIHDKYENRHEWVYGDMKDIIKDIENYKK